jgi:hypothetical protein
MFAEMAAKTAKKHLYKNDLNGGGESFYDFFVLL